MTILGKALMLAVLAVATASAAQSVSAPTATPSAVNETAPLIRPLSGTLFFGQQQRDRMDRARKRPEISVDGVSDEPTPSVLNGFVKRSDGQITIWVDGQARNNVRNAKVHDLQPQDVGGNSETLRILVPNSTANVSPPPMRPKSAKKQVSHRTAVK